MKKAWFTRVVCLPFLPVPDAKLLPDNGRQGLLHLAVGNYTGGGGTLGQLAIRLEPGLHKSLSISKEFTKDRDKNVFVAGFSMLTASSPASEHLSVADSGLLLP